MSKLPSVTGADAKRVFERAGFREVRMKGSHCIMHKEGHKNLLSIPMHGTKPLGKGLLRNLIRTAGLSVEEFCDLLADN